MQRSTPAPDLLPRILLRILSRVPGQAWFGAAAAGFALGASWLLVRLDRHGVGVQALVAVGVVVLLLGTLLYLLSPDMVLAGFVFALPLLYSGDSTTTLNPGEIATLFVGGLGVLSLLATPPRSTRALRPITWPLVALVIVAIVSALVNGITDPQALVRVVLKPLSYALIAVLVWARVDTWPKVDRLIRAVLLGGAAAAAFSVYSVITGAERAAGTFEHFNQLGGFMALVSVPTLAYAVSTKRVPRRLLFLGAFVAELFALAYSLTLGSVLALGIASLAGLMVLFRNRPGRALSMTGLLGIVLIAAWVATPALGAKAEIASQRAEGRLATYAGGIGLAAAHPWVGVGSTDEVLVQIEQNPELAATAFGTTESIPHNSYILIWAGHGIVALFLLLLVSFEVIQILRRRPPPSSPMYLLHLGIFVGCLGFLIQNLTNNLILDVRLGLVFFVLVVMGMKIRLLSLPQTPVAAPPPDVDQM